MDLRITSDGDLYLQPDDVYIRAGGGADWVRFDTGIGERESGAIHVCRNGTADPVVRIQEDLNQGGMLMVYDETGTVVGSLEPDMDTPAGGYLALKRNSSTYGFVVDGNYNDSQNPRVTITGSSRSAEFNMNASGDDAVGLPSQAISASEILDEPGLASRIQSGSTTLTGCVQAILSRTITAPSNGYVLGIVTCEASVDHTNGIDSWAVFPVADNLDVPGHHSCLSPRIAASAGSRTYRFAVAVQDIFPLSAGSHTFCFLADEGLGEWSVGNIQFTLIHLPSNHGLVTLAPGPVIPDEEYSQNGWFPDSVTVSGLFLAGYSRTLSRGAGDGCNGKEDE